MTNDYAPLLSATHDNNSGVDLHCAVKVSIETYTDVAEVFAGINIIINQRASRLTYWAYREFRESIIDEAYIQGLLSPEQNKVLYLQQIGGILKQKKQIICTCFISGSAEDE